MYSITKSQQLSRSYQAYVVLTLCRAFYAYKYGESISKKQAALWAAKIWPKWSILIQDSLMWHKTVENEKINLQKNYSYLKEFIHDIIDQVGLL